MGLHLKPFWALRIHEDHDQAYAKLQQMRLEDLTPGEVIVEVHYSSVNYKDALASTGKGKILKRFPLNCGIDASGVVIESLDPRFKPGQHVIVAGSGTGENNDGGYAEVLRAPAQSVVPLPPGLTLKESMILGTAGFTAALALHRMLENHQKPEMGPILVTGASGGVGSFAVQLFSQQGFEVHAVSGKHEAIKFLKELGAKEVIAPEELHLGKRPLETARFGGIVDNVGGELLSHALAHVQLWGNVACIGLAQSANLNVTVMPFILRGVSLLGASSNNCPTALRSHIWQKLGSDWKPKMLERILSRTVELKDVTLVCDELLHRKVRGRVLVQIRADNVPTFAKT